MVTKQGLCIVNVDGKNVLMYNGVKVSTRLAGTLRHMGIYINGQKLVIDHSGIAESSSESPSLNGNGKGKLYFGGVELTESGKCVNITESDYNTLIGGGLVAGYKAYSTNEIYNIVANPASAAIVTYTIDNNVVTFSTGVTAELSSSGLYNSMANTIQENTEDLTATIENTACPNVHVRYFNPVIAVGDTITLDYFVDTRNMSSLQYSTVHDTFTLIVTTPYGMVKKTTYAGFYQITLPAFSESGVKWFSVRCIDSNGVGSEEQFFDVLVKAPHTDVVYTMTSADLEPFEYNGNTYQITINDDDVQTAFANKAALTAFFAKVKADGADKVVMYNNMADNDGKGTIYWIDYHGVFGTQRYFRCGVSEKKITSVEEITENELPNSWTRSTNAVPKVGNSCDTTESTYYYVINTSVSSKHIAFPDHFTIDLNGSTIAATQSYDLGSGELIQLNNNTDTHIINGSIKGNAENFDFLTSRKRCGTSTEWLSVVSMSASKYCSFENLDVSRAEGFDSALGATNTNIGHWLSSIGLNADSSIDLATGEDITKTDMVRSGSFGVTGGEIISFGRNGYNMYLDMGPEREFFYCFYDSNGNYIGFIKSHFYRLTKVPQGAVTAKIVGYGKIAPSKDAAGDTDWKPDSSRGTLMVFRPKLCRNIVIKNCNWHDTRTTAITNMTARGVLLENCTYQNIAIGDPNAGVVTPLLGDLEDSWQWASNLYLKGNKWISSNGCRNIKVYYARSFEFINNTGFDFIDAGGVESGVFEGDTINGFTINRTRSCYFPSVVYRNNKIGLLSINWGSGITWTHKQAERVVAMSDSTISVRCQYDNLLLMRCKNGLEVVD